MLVFMLNTLSLLSSRVHSSPSHARVSAMRGGGGGGVRSPPLSTKIPTTPTRRTLAFSTPESLSDWLRPRLPSDSFASWGVKPGTKTVHNLWLELSHGETSLFHDDHPHNDDPQHPLLRTVHVASVRIRNASEALLVESHQLMSDGTMRLRSRPLSEKMKPGETVEEAANRAVMEELGVEGVRIRMGSYEVRVEEKASMSYPGLPARYVLHSVDAEVDGLPEDGEFSTEEVGEGCEEGEVGGGKILFVKRHFWKWVNGGDHSVGGADANADFRSRDDDDSSIAAV